MSGVLHDKVSPTTLGVVRTVVFFMWLVVIVPDPLSFYGHLPSMMFQPIGVFVLVPSGAWSAFLAPGVLDGFKVVVVVVVVLAMIGIGPYRLIATAAAVLLTVHQGLVREFTFADHAELTLLVETYLLAVAPAADGFAWRRRRATASDPGIYSAVLVAMAFFLLIPYCAIAAHRIAFAAPGVFTGDSLPSFFAGQNSVDRDGSGLGRWILGHAPLIAFFKAGFLVTTIFELLAPLCLVLPRFRRAWVLVVLSFHLLNRFTLNLFFWENAVLVVLLISDTERIVMRVRAAISRARASLQDTDTVDAPAQPPS